MRKRDVSDAGAVEFKGAKGPLDAYSWVEKDGNRFREHRTTRRKESEDDSVLSRRFSSSLWTFTKRNNDGAQTMTWEQFKALFLGQYFNHSHRSRIQSNFLSMAKRDDEGVIEFEQRFTTLS